MEGRLGELFSPETWRAGRSGVSQFSCWLEVKYQQGRVSDSRIGYAHPKLLSADIQWTGAPSSLAASTTLTVQNCLHLNGSYNPHALVPYSTYPMLNPTELTPAPSRAPTPEVDDGVCTSGWPWQHLPPYGPTEHGQAAKGHTSEDLHLSPEAYCVPGLRAWTRFS